MSNTRQDKSRRHGSRYRARRRAVDIIFEAEARDIDPVAIVDDRIELSQQPDPPVKPVAPYTQEIVGGVAVELDRVDEVISRYLLDNWMLERLPAVDRAILRVATWELLSTQMFPLKLPWLRAWNWPANIPPMRQRHTSMQHLMLSRVPWTTSAPRTPPYNSRIALWCLTLLRVRGWVTTRRRHRVLRGCGGYPKVRRALHRQVCLYSGTKIPCFHA